MPTAFPRAVTHFAAAAQAQRPKRVTGELVAADDRRVRRLRRSSRRTLVVLWLPTTALFLLLAPFALLLTPFLYLAPRAVLPRPAMTVLGVGALLLSLSGTVVEVDSPDAQVRLRLF